MDWDWIQAEVADYKARTEKAEKERDLWKEEALAARKMINLSATLLFYANFELETNYRLAVVKTDLTLK